jgi:hypothetical protein
MVNNSSRWLTHIPLLIRTFDLSDGDVLEIGTGMYSTLILDWLSRIYKRNVYSYEDNEEWYNRVNKYESPYHKIIKISNWDKLPAKIRPSGKRWGMVFVDHRPEGRRIVEVNRFANLADYIVIHDSQDEKKVKFDQVRKLFKYTHDWKKANTWTSVVSNFKNLKNL